MDKDLYNSLVVLKARLDALLDEARMRKNIEVESFVVFTIDEMKISLIGEGVGWDTFCGDAVGCRQGYGVLSIHTTDVELTPERADMMRRAVMYHNTISPEKREILIRGEWPKGTIDPVWDYITGNLQTHDPYND